LPLARGEAETSRALAEDRQTEKGWRSSFRGRNRQPALPGGGVLMASASVPGIYGWGNLSYPSLSGVLRPLPSPRCSDLRIKQPRLANKHAFRQDAWQTASTPSSQYVHMSQRSLRTAQPTASRLGAYVAPACGSSCASVVGAFQRHSFKARG
jgi:hypothetical protein